jgi:glycolate oxidase iron-sulfur subunit
MSDRIIREKIDRVLETGAQIVTAANTGCLLQIRRALAQRGSSVRAEHPIVILERAYFGRRDNQE